MSAPIVGRRKGATPLCPLRSTVFSLRSLFGIEHALAWNWLVTRTVSRMRRDLCSLANETFDVVVIGGGAFGAAAARAAALRGLRTALIERDDLGQGASAECFKMVHGGIRYLQHADIVRARASCRERSAFLRTAPHLVKPLPIAIPTYGHGRQGKLLLRAGMRAYDLLTLDRNRGIRDASRRIAAAQFLSRRETLELFPHLNAQRLTGAAVFEDGQMHNPARLVIALAKSAANAGATTCNYVEATDFIFSGDTVRGVHAIDRITGDPFEISARMVLNAAGPWADYLLRDRSRFRYWQRGPFSRDAYFIVDRAPTSKFALAITGQSSDQDALLSRAKRHLFLVPWRDKTLVGVWHRLFDQHPDRAHIEEDELHAWLDELNTVNRDLHLRREEITFGHCGLVPFGEHADAASLQFGKETRFIDHRLTHRIQGLVSVIGIRYTMARLDAEHALDMLLAQCEREAPRINSELISVAGGEIDDFAALRSNAQANRPRNIEAATLDALLCHHGCHYAEVLKRVQIDPRGADVVPGTQVIAAEIQHAIEDDMAIRLSDVVFRRTDMSGHAHPGRAALEFAAAHMSRLAGWSLQRMDEELAMTESALAAHHAIDRTRTPVRVDRAASFGSVLAPLSARKHKMGA